MLARLVPVAALVMLPAVALAQADAPSAMTAEARKIASDLQGALAPRLMKEITERGAAGAIGVCKDIGGGAALALSERSDAKVSRVSLRPRNPVLGPADAWEQAALLEFDRRAAAGEAPQHLERAEIVQEPAGRYFRYAKALPVMPLCLNCHGDPARLDAEVRAKLTAEYPNDRATGYSVGQIRGAITIKRPL